MYNKSNVWIITPKTNLHVGDDNTSSYGLIDLAIQRDVVTEIPCINSSSLKGAINEYSTLTMTGDDRKDIFGSDKISKESQSQKGGCSFFDAKLLAIPVPDDNKMYKLVTCQEVIDDCIKMAKLFGINLTERDILPQGTAKVSSLEKFKEYCNDDNLPIIARNVLDNGISQNLWYEQVMPTESVFFTLILGKDEYMKKLNNTLHEKIVQIGANATIGYGYCEVHHL